MCEGKTAIYYPSSIPEGEEEKVQVGWIQDPGIAQSFANTEYIVREETRPMAEVTQSIKDDLIRLRITIMGGTEKQVEQAIKDNHEEIRRIRDEIGEKAVALPYAELALWESFSSDNLTTAAEAFELCVETMLEHNIEGIQIGMICEC